MESVAATRAMPSTLNRACIAFSKNDFAQALRLYQAVLRTHVSGSHKAAVLLGVGHCFAKLNDPSNARQAFEQALVHHPRCVEALVALSVVYINLNTPKSIRCGVQLLSKAYAIDAANPITLNHLANHYFNQKDYQNVQVLALRAMQTENEAIKAESCYQLGRVFHVLKDFEQAFKYYHQSTQLASSQFVLPFFGLGKIYIQKGDFDNAAKCFETVLKSKPDNYEAMKILASLYAKSPDQEKREIAIKRLNQITAIRPDDVEAWIELAQLTQNKDIDTALYAYRKAIEKDVRDEVQPEILNNIAVLLFRLGDFKAAEKCYVGSLEISKRKTALNAISVTTTYNLARVYEALREFDKATNCYQSVLRDHPNYLDCYLRLGCMARDRGDTFDASFHFKEALNVDQENIEAWILIANMHFAKLEIGPAQSIYERILMKIPKGKNDSYALIALGNVWLGMLHMKVDKNKIKTYQDRALEMYQHALKNDPDNAWATNGVGCVLAYKGFLEEAREMFLLVRETTAEFADARINLAHMYVQYKQFHLAIQLYKQCLELEPSSVQVLLYLARAYFKSGSFVDCKSTLLKARRIAPEDNLLRFNVTVVLETMAGGAMKAEKAELSTVLKAVKELGIAERDFQYLSVHGDPNLFDLARNTLQKCKDVKIRATYYVTRARQLEKMKTQNEEKNRKIIESNRKQAECDAKQQERKKEEVLEWKRKEAECAEKQLQNIREAMRRKQKERMMRDEEVKREEETASKKSRKRKITDEEGPNTIQKRKRTV